VPAYLLRENLPVVKQRLDRIEIVTSDAQGWFGRQPDASINALSLSNICELMSPEETGRLFAEVARAAAPGARICFRNLVVPRAIPESMADQIVLDDALAAISSPAIAPLSTRASRHSKSRKTSHVSC
jgi:S-adenosylmethionine-diacylglycerol 3-amino-3-carboxypropyl transferase